MEASRVRARADAGTSPVQPNSRCPYPQANTAAGDCYQDARLAWPLPVGRPVGSRSVPSAEVNDRQNELRQSVGDGSLGAHTPAPVYRGDWRSPGTALSRITLLTV